MARLSSFSVTFEVEPVVKLLCEETECKYNLASKPSGWLLQSEAYHNSSGRLLFCKDRLVEEVAVRDGEQP